MDGKNRFPNLEEEKLYIPFVGAIIERKGPSGEKEILIQIRQKELDPLYNGSIEIPGGKLKAYEDVYEAIKREVKEESGLEITFIEKENSRVDLQNRGDVSSLIEPFCVTQMQNGPFVGLIFLCKAIGQPSQITDEARDIRWIAVSELRKIIELTPEKIYTAFLGSLKKYLS
jgi:8-oxo-dGTP diphosphatase